MLDFNEIKNYEKFEDLCEILLQSMNLRTRRLGRGPGQLGKDLIAFEQLKGPISDTIERKYLVECKFTLSNNSISEKDVFNVYDRVISQEAEGYFLFTNARLSVNLEKTLFDLKISGKIKIVIWSQHDIIKHVLNNINVFRLFFPLSFQKWSKESHIIFNSLFSQILSPTIHVKNKVLLLLNAPDGTINSLNKNEIYMDIVNTMDMLIAMIDSQSDKFLETETLTIKCTGC